MEKNLNINFIDNGSDKAILKSMAIDEHHEYDKECLKNTLNSVEDLEKSMRDKSKLVQVERQISGKNGTFTRKYWVSPDQVKKTDIVVGSQQQISEENFPKGSKLYYKGQEATVVRVGREFSGGGMGIVVNFKSGGTGTISKNDLKNVTKEAPKQQQAVSDKKDESQKYVTTKDIKGYSAETIIESNGEGSNGSVRTMMVKVSDNHWMKKMYDKKDNKWHVVPGGSKTDIQTKKYFDKFGVKTIDTPKTSNSSKFDGDTIINALNDVNQGVTKRFATSGSTNIKNIAMNISGKKAFMKIVSDNNGVVKYDDKDNGTGGNFVVNGHKVDFLLKGKKLVLSFDESQLGKEGDSPKRSENIPSKFNGRSVSDLVSSMEKYGFTIDSADRHSPQKYVTLYKDNKEYTATFNKYNDGSVEILNIKESKASSDLTPVQKDCLDKISKMFVPEDVKKDLEYGVKKKHLVLVSKDGKYKTAKDWDEADYAKHNGWKVEGSLIDRIKSGSIGSIVSGRYDLSQMSESALKDRMKQVTDRISKLSNDIKNNGKSRGQLNSVATDSQKKEYDELVAENGNLMIELGNRKKNTTDKKVVTKDDAKKSVQDYLKKNSGDKAKTIADFKSMGITWEEKEHPAINWMRANMAAQKFFMNQK